MSVERGDAGLRLSVVVPTYESSDTLGACLDALVAASRPGDEIIVADDGSARDPAEQHRPAAPTAPAAAASVRFVRNPSNIGRGPIRNLGAKHASGDVLVFVDSDVAVHRDALDLVRAAFAEDPDRVCLIGSYDDRPAAAGLVSQYRNLLHHHTHHTAGPWATHFWTGLGAVRRDVFEALGGLDEVTWARNMEDVEFGHRLVAAGHRIDVRADIQGTHLKRFTLRSMTRIDLFDRAIPWSTLVLRRGMQGDRFVTSGAQRLSAAGAVAFVGGLAAGTRLRWARLAALAGLAVFAAANRPLLRFLARARGVRFAVAAVPLHLLHASVSVAGFATAAARHLWARLRG